MIKLQTIADVGKSRYGFSYNDKILVCGSCFADNIGGKLAASGFDVCVNPFGTLYNPVSISNSFARLRTSTLFSEDEVIQLGSGSELFCSFSHHTSFARKSVDEFIANANEKLAEAAAFYKDANLIIITLGTSWCFRHLPDGETVSNCLKRHPNEFERYFLDSETSFKLLSNIVERAESQEQTRKKRFIFTVSPIRHLKDGAHGNQISKSALLIAVDKLCSKYSDICEYFPSYEIMMDELRDYRFYAEDMTHPSDLAIKYIWERFCDFGLPESQKETLSAKEREFRRSQHIPFR